MSTKDQVKFRTRSYELILMTPVVLSSVVVGRRPFVRLKRRAIIDVIPTICQPTQRNDLYGIKDPVLSW